MSGFVTFGLRPRSQSNRNSYVYSNWMTKGLHRYYGNHDLHFITCSCYHRQPQLSTPECGNLFLSILEQARQKYRFVVHGYVIMPDHFHLLMTEPEVGDPSVVMKVVKERYSRKLRTEGARPRPSGKPPFSGIHHKRGVMGRTYKWRLEGESW
jgi:REP element-mobilizing transposase RayT